jgi:predicted CoA-binding protein
MTHDDEIKDILTSVKTIALVGWSPKEDRPSHRVAKFLFSKGYRVIPVNPGQAGQDVGLSAPVAASLADIHEPIDMVDIFRRSEEVYAVVEQGLTVGAKVIWMQLGIEDAKAVALARAQGARVVMDRCPAIEMPRLGL